MSDKSQRIDKSPATDVITEEEGGSHMGWDTYHHLGIPHLRIS